MEQATDTMEILLTDIQERLNSKVAALKYIDEDWGQLDDYSPNFPVQWPCCLVDCSNANYENMGKNVQLGLATIRLLIGNIKLTNSSQKAPAGQKLQNKSFRVLMTAIYTALQGWAGSEGYSKLIRIREGRIKRNDGVKVHEMFFTVEIKDSSAMPTLTTLAAPTIVFEKLTE